MARVEFRDVTIRYGGVEAVRQVSLGVEDGGYCCLLGPSGCGKTSLLRGLAGFVPVASGDVLIDGKRVNGVYPGRRNLAMIFQNFALYPHLTVRGNFEFPLRAAGGRKAAIAERVGRVAAQLGMEPFLDRLPRELSGGQQQRVAIGRALVRTPRAFLLDEPLGNLDALLKVQMRATLRQLHDELGATFIHVTHDQSEAMALADLVVVMNRGRVEQAGAPVEVYERPASLFVAGFVGNPPMNLIEGTVRMLGELPSFSSGSLEMDLAGVPAQPVLRRYVGKAVVLGVRPEHVSVGTASSGGVRARVLVEEFAGKEVVLDLVVGPHPLKARVERDGLGGGKLAGAEVALGVAKDRVMLFDPATGSRIG